jgi:hypothetical protein
MKYRCPHCRELFDDLDKTSCPKCNKALRHPLKWKSLKTDKARREGIQQRMPPSHELRKPIWTLFFTSPRFAVWVLGGCILVGGVILSSKGKVTTIYQGPNKIDKTRKELVVLRTALEWFRVHCQRYPTTEESLRALVRDPGVEGWKGFYIPELPPDLWGHHFYYTCSNDVVQLSSLGPDGKTNTADDIQSPAADYKALMKRLAKEAPATSAVTNTPAQ